MKRLKNCKKCGNTHNKNYCHMCKSPRPYLKSNIFDNMPKYDPHQMLSSHCWTPTELIVQKCMNKYQTKQIYNPKTEEVEMSTILTHGQFEINDVIKFSNRNLINDNIAGKKFLVTKVVYGRFSIMSLDDDEITLCLDGNTLIDLSAAKVGYRRVKPIGFWASIRKEPKYEIISLNYEKEKE